MSTPPLLPSPSPLPPLLSVPAIVSSLQSVNPCPPSRVMSFMPSKHYFTAPLSYLHVRFPGRFPLEICEEIIDQLRDDSCCLRACALTCRDWHIRSRFHLLRSIHFAQRYRPSAKHEDIDEFCSYLASYQSLPPLVQSLHIHWNLLCTPLLRQLPNLRHTELIDNDRHRGPLTLHTSFLAYFRAYLHIETLCLSHVDLCSPRRLTTLILSIPSLRYLVCDNISVSGKAEESSHIAASTRKVDFRKRTKFRHLEVSIAALQYCV